MANRTIIEYDEHMNAGKGKTTKQNNTGSAAMALFVTHKKQKP